MDDTCYNDTMRFMDLLESAGLQQKVAGATHNRGHTLDLIIVRQEESLLCSPVEIYPVVSSDHSAIICSADLPRPCATKKVISHRDLRHMDMESWRDDIRNSTLHNAALGSCIDTNILTDQYNNVLRELIDKHAPIHTRSITLRPNAPWFNDSLRALKRQRRQLERKYVTTRLEVHRQIYKEQCHVYNSAINSVKSDYYKAQISGSTQSQLFHMIDGLFKVKAVPPLPSHESLHSLAEDFSNFFVSKIQKLKDDLRSSSLASMELSIKITSSPCQSSFSEFTKISENYTREVVKHSKSKSCVLDPVPTHILKQSVDVLASPLNAIINTSLTSGVFPASLKKGIVYPSIKKQSLDQEEFPSYRPITNVAFLSKTLERVAATQTIDYLIANDLLAKLQSAYRCFHSTETALLRVFNDILVAIDRHQEVVLVLLDLSSAFDTIDHTALLTRLRCRYGINGSVLKWFESYLTDRSQALMVRDVSSASLPINWIA